MNAALMNAKAEEVKKAFHTFWQIWSERKNKAKTITDILPFFDESVTAIGTGEHEKGRSFEEVVKNFTDDFAELQVPIQLDFFREIVKVVAPTVGLVEAEAYLKIAFESSPDLEFHLRFSTLFVEKEGGWKIVHNHVSIPSDGQNVGEAYPIDQLRAKNDRLEKEVQERTIKLRERTQQLKKEKETTERLLHNILPEIVAHELIETGQVLPASFEQVSVLFSDFVGFTKLASRISAGQLVEELGEIFHQFDNIVKDEQLEKIKTIGDSYMAACGVPGANGQHAFRCIQAGMKMLAYLEERNKGHDIQWQMRVGVHTGPVIAGVVGNHKFTYDLWGNTVNVASRLESNSQGGRINISNQTYELVKQHFACEHRGKFKVKGGQEIDMYFVNPFFR